MSDRAGVAPLDTVAILTLIGQELDETQNLLKANAYQYTETLKAQLSTLRESLTTEIQSVEYSIADTKRSIEGVQTTLENVIQPLLDRVTVSLDNLAAELPAKLQEIVESFADIKIYIDDELKTLREGVTDSITSSTDIIRGDLSALSSGIRTGIIESERRVTEEIRENGEAIGEKISRSTEAVIKDNAGQTEAVTNTITETSEALTTTIEEIKEDLLKVIADQNIQFEKLLDGILTAIKEFTTYDAATLQTKLFEAYNDIKAVNYPQGNA